MSTKLEKQQCTTERPRKETTRDSRSSLILYTVGGLALLGLAGLVIANIPDLKRYIRISTM